MARYAVVWERAAEADLAVFPRTIRAAIRREVERLLADQPVPEPGREGQRKALAPNPLGAAHRVRVVNTYRAYYEVDVAERRVFVLRVGHKPGETLFLRGVPTPMRDEAGRSASMTTERAYRIAALTPKSPDPEARADANNPELMAALADARAQRRPGSGRTTAQLEMDDPLTAEEEGEVAALLREAAAADRAAGVVENALPGRTHLRGRKPTGASGKLNVRLPIHLHKELVEQATADGVSLNTLIVGLLERGVGAAKAASALRAT